ncbi:hypothetical protein SISNIDRAFT_482762 [Sistotremastrum niveocremeum HHB9708]|uniref:Uncharacterized protein n=1 Tax=Sistotremastrum niveocremeum HHB9708 TaxID=1314777 RepID=A0A164YKH4_9AGAM|nr:hypothetical protein SISNIDRAFT_482762 [Sistotremastrum niveocremeum HHB9708]
MKSLLSFTRGGRAHVTDKSTADTAAALNVAVMKLKKILKRQQFTQDRSLSSIRESVPLVPRLPLDVLRLIADWALQSDDLSRIVCLARVSRAFCSWIYPSLNVTLDLSRLRHTFFINRSPTTWAQTKHLILPPARQASDSHIIARCVNLVDLAIISVGYVDSPHSDLLEFDLPQLHSITVYGFDRYLGYLGSPPILGHCTHLYLTINGGGPPATVFGTLPALTHLALQTGIHEFAPGWSDEYLPIARMFPTHNIDSASPAIQTYFRLLVQDPRLVLIVLEIFDPLGSVMGVKDFKPSLLEEIDGRVVVLRSSLTVRDRWVASRRQGVKSVWERAQARFLAVADERQEL